MTSVPTFIEPENITQLSHDKLTDFLENLQTHRLRAFEVYQETQRISQLEEDEQNRQRLKKANEMLIKEIGRLDKYLDKLGERVRKVQILRMELGYDPGKGMKEQ